MDIALQTTLATVIQQLASFMGTTVETIQVNAPYWLAIYGRHKLVTDIVPNLIVGILIFILFLLCGMFIVGIYITVSGKDAEDFLKKHIKFLMFLAIAMILLPNILTVIQYCISPELFGLQALIKMIK